MEEKKYSVPALDKGFDILEYLVEQKKPLSQSEIAKGIGRKPNDIYRVLVNLEARGYLNKDNASGRYQVAFKLYNLSRNISPIDEVRQCALPLMEDLAVSIGQSCHLAMLYQSQTMVMVQARSHSPISININEGCLFSTLQSTSGKVLLANSNQAVQQMLLNRDDDFNSMSKTQQQSLYNELNDIKHCGFISGENQLSHGIYEFSTLVGQPDGKVIAALTVSSLQSIWDKSDITFLTDTTLDTARLITQQLGNYP
ncbi:IclR family transcriptional regulator [Shewanella donghaensis]|uniref:IclR family transcriptional regulator n=1 Tax=Shewanella donghaensis TaxID=238836 RepID=UPI001183A14E|nr:helix-turn-helix domain-containing protein [Shewanella donghaensis]